MSLCSNFAVFDTPRRGDFWGENKKWGDESLINFLHKGPEIYFGDEYKVRRKAGKDKIFGRRPPPPGPMIQQTVKDQEFDGEGRFWEILIRNYGIS